MIIVILAMVMGSLIVIAFTLIRMSRMFVGLPFDVMTMTLYGSAVSGLPTSGWADNNLGVFSHLFIPRGLTVWCSVGVMLMWCSVGVV